MPAIDKFECDQCDFAMPSGWGCFTYAVDKQGKRITCPHPAEIRVARKATGLREYGEMKEKGVIGLSKHVVCADCLEQCALDFDRDTLKCPKCDSESVRTIEDLVDQPCPKCKNGSVRRIPTGMFT